jgi:Cof subfamily protein (haloacid dehalogenase superfamily)
MTDKEWKKIGSNIKLIATDMDGTLLGSDKQVGVANKEAVKCVGNKDIRFTICTGRIHTMTEAYIKELSIETPIIAANGAIIWDGIKHEILWGKPMVHEEALAILQFGAKQHMDYIAMAAEGCYYSTASSRKERFFEYNRIAKSKGFHEMLVEPFDDEGECIRGKHIYKILFCEVDGKQNPKVVAFLKDLQNTTYVSSDVGLLDISHKEVSKGSGLAKLCEILGISNEEVVTFGDYQNDISMIKFAKLGIAMGNATAEIKEVAEYVTDTNDDNGFANAIKKLIC